MRTKKEKLEGLVKIAKEKGFKGGIKIEGMGNKAICELPIDGDFELLNNKILWFGIEGMGFDIFKSDEKRWATILE